MFTDPNPDQPTTPADDTFYADPTGLLCADDGVSDPSPMAIRRRERDRKLAERIQKAVEDAGRLIPEIPPISSDCGAPGMVPRDMPDLDRANSLVMDAYFSGVKMSFREDANGFKDTLIVKELRPSQPGDIDYLTGDDIDRTDGVELNKVNSDPAMAAELRNQKNQKMKFMLGATFKNKTSSSLRVSRSTQQCTVV